MSLAKTLRVKSSPGLLVPRENEKGSYIGQEPVIVENTPYYRRLLAIGDLLVWPRPQRPLRDYPSDNILN